MSFMPINPVEVIGHIRSGKLRVLLEVRVEREETKSGVEIEALPEVAEGVATLPHLDLAGLMCIPPDLLEAERVRP